MARHLHAAGGPLVGKGLCGKKLKDAYGNGIYSITVGDLVRARRQKDLAFEKRYGELIDDGFLVPDEEINPMVVHHYEMGTGLGHELFYWDGWNRNPHQVATAKKLGVLDPKNSMVAILKASRCVCYDRLLHRRGLKPNGDRPDDKVDEVFNRRWNIFATHFRSVRKALAQERVPILKIDARQDLGIVTELMLEGAQKLRPVCREQGLLVGVPV